ncbi:helicase C-terminal domain-containing protein [Hyphomonas pacifica]|uniref:Uncharacterized protein n=1 Tax=Hyphomonas pacifica TaxID=1280941 RepID=A0A062U3Q7_9PROT|nr:helicase C-terminal domain-containing protein [Hyphomonas pacifica]KCZ51229.1 hypothetical protein HY2_11785 [Hyphomonas pacifica]RAN33512.1 hypothetical protein HY3_12695 [Hyphomonas pacifica]
MSESEKYAAAERFIGWLSRRVEDDATGANMATMESRPEGRFWLGRLAPEREIHDHDLGERAERLEPCAVGMRVLPKTADGKVRVSGRAGFVVWSRSDGEWRKSPRIVSEFSVEVDLFKTRLERLRDAFTASLEEHETSPAISAAIDIEIGRLRDGRHDMSITLVNTSDPDHEDAAANSRGRIFECSLELKGLDTDDFLLESLPDSFRYDRRVSAWGINAGVTETSDGFRTTDMPIAQKRRPKYWNVDGGQPDLSFETLSTDPIPPLEALVAAHAGWGEEAWRIDRLVDSMRDAHESTGDRTDELKAEKELFVAEARRLRAGVDALKADEVLMRAFKMMNEAMIISARGRYEGWRPFQIGFLLANIASCRREDSGVVDIVWFATGGGKTETYLGLILTAAFLDRMRGKVTGVTAWSRFPLRLLSLQQTQRFANALAAAEIVRRRHELPGDSFGLGFLVGDGSTPNKISDERSPAKRGRWDPDDLSMPDKLRMLKVCPFCRADSIEMRFRRSFWRLEHRCTNDQCEWGPEAPLPIHVVDTEVWRNLPTVIVGTLDKAAGIAMQANMKGMIGAPSGFCPEEHHGHTYAPRSGRPNGCLVPDCNAPRGALPQSEALYGMTYRLQDELHLLRDSLGAVDAHYEALLDHLQFALCGAPPKVLASSATLTGYQRQSDVLYHRRARVFPHPEPRIGNGFWAGDTAATMRRYLAVAPRGQTIEYALDRMVVSLQGVMREVAERPEEVSQATGIDPELMPFLLDTYGTDVIYGNTLRDLDAVVRSAATQWGDIPLPRPNIASLTGRTQFEEVASTLERLEEPEENFGDRLHVVAASSMMSHGVDVDRLNVMVMLGLPLTTAEFIQATARVGRRWPALAFVVHKIGRERDASIYRAFPKYVTQGDRFVEPIPITGRSRRVLERTIPGLAFARVLMLHEHLADRTVWKAYGLKEYIEKTPGFAMNEAKAICDLLGYDDAASAALKHEVESWYETWVRRVSDPANAEEWANALGLPTGAPMRSLRDVADQIDVWGRDPT